MDLSIYEDEYDYEMKMNIYEGNEFDNTEALEKRFSLILIEKGSGIINIDGKEIPFAAPVVFCMSENENVVIDKKYKLNIKAILFHPSVINYKFDFKNIRKTPQNFIGSEIQDAFFNKYFIDRTKTYYGKLSVGPVTFKRFLYLYSMLKKQVTEKLVNFWPCRSRSFLLEALFLIDNIYCDDSYISDSVTEVEDKEIQEVLLYLYNNYNNKITITNLTKEFNINRTTLSKRFNEAVGDPIITYLNKLRINIAAVILRDTRVPVAEVMERVGFNDSIHFLRTFKKYMCLSPKEYRDKYCWVD